MAPSARVMMDSLVNFVIKEKILFNLGFWLLSLLFPLFLVSSLPSMLVCFTIYIFLIIFLNLLYCYCLCFYEILFKINYIIDRCVQMKRAMAIKDVTDRQRSVIRRSDITINQTIGIILLILIPNHIFYNYYLFCFNIFLCIILKLFFYRKGSEWCGVQGNVEGYRSCHQEISGP